MILKQYIIIKMQGPIYRSNWIIKDILLVGEYPSKLDIDEIKRNMEILVNSGIDVFISLMEPHEREMTPPYESFLCETPFNIFEENYYQERSSERYNKTFKFLNLPIVDRRIVDDDKIIEYVDRVYDFIKEGKKVFIHCKKGKGRTGTLVSLLLCKYYNFTPTEALSQFYLYYMDRQPRPKMFPRLKRRQQVQVKKLGIELNKKLILNEKKS
jgi:protein-tyrosine phosphatase